MANKKKSAVNLDDILTRIKVKLVANYPFFANLLFHLPLCADESIPTLATDGRKILFNPGFASTLEQSELAFVLLHETLHVALGHLWRRGTRDSSVWNCAADYVINNILEDECVNPNAGSFKISFPRDKDGRIGLFEPRYKEWSAEKVYNELMIKIHKNKLPLKSGIAVSEVVDKQRTSSQPQTQVKIEEIFAKAIGSHDLWNKIPEPEVQQISQEWAGRVAEAATAAKMAGKMPAGIEAQLGKLLKPQKNWKLLLREFIETENFDFSWNPPDRRFSDSDFFMPDFNEKIEKVKDLYFFIDASGSMSNNDINKCASEIQGAIYQFKHHLHGKMAYFDTVVYDYYDFDEIQGDISTTRPKGRGGTSFAVVAEAVKGNSDSIAGVIILTDGFCTFPPEKEFEGIPVLWIFTDPDRKAPYGQYTTLE